MRRTLALMGLVAWATLATGLWAQDKWSKQIHVSAAKLRATIAMQESYGVGEPITFKVKTNKNAYLYIFYVPEKGKVAKLLYPNKDDRNNRIKADEEVIIPDKSEFTSDEEGKEKLIFVFSTKKLKSDIMVLLHKTDDKGFSYAEGEDAEALLRDLQVLQDEGKKKKREIIVKEVIVKIEEE